MTTAGLWLRIALGTGAAAGSLLIPLDAPEASVPLAPALLVGALAGTMLYCALAGTRPVLHRGPLTRRRVTRVSFCLVWATVEETLWRRLILASLALQLGWIVALVVSSAGFALSHRIGWPGHLVTGLGLGSVYLATGQLLAAIAMHTVYNLLLDERLERRRSLA
jgi:membrane protease YdiL (CAAX protease family)